MTSTSSPTETHIPDGIEMTDPYADDPAFELHRGGKLSIASRVPINGPEDLSTRLHAWRRSRLAGNRRRAVTCLVAHGSVERRCRTLERHRRARPR